MDTFYKKYCFYHPESKTFFHKNGLEWYGHMDPGKDPSWIDKYKGKLTLNIDDAFVVPEKFELDNIVGLLRIPKSIINAWFEKNPKPDAKYIADNTLKYLIENCSHLTSNHEYMIKLDGEYKTNPDIIIISAKRLVVKEIQLMYVS